MAAIKRYQGNTDFGQWVGERDGWMGGVGWIGGAISREMHNLTTSLQTLGLTVHIDDYSRGVFVVTGIEPQRNEANFLSHNRMLQIKGGNLDNAKVRALFDAIAEYKVKILSLTVNTNYDPVFFTLLARDKNLTSVWLVGSDPIATGVDIPNEMVNIILQNKTLKSLHLDHLTPKLPRFDRVLEALKYNESLNEVTLSVCVVQNQDIHKKIYAMLQLNTSLTKFGLPCMANIGSSNPELLAAIEQELESNKPSDVINSARVLVKGYTQSIMESSRSSAASAADEAYRPLSFQLLKSLSQSAAGGIKRAIEKFLLKNGLPLDQVQEVINFADSLNEATASSNLFSLLGIAKDIPQDNSAFIFHSLLSSKVLEFLTPTDIDYSSSAVNQLAVSAAGANSAWVVEE